VERGGEKRGRGLPTPYRDTGYVFFKHLARCRKEEKNSSEEGEKGGNPDTRKWLPPESTLKFISRRKGLKERRRGLVRDEGDHLIVREIKKRDLNSISPPKKKGEKRLTTNLR